MARAVIRIETDGFIWRALRVASFCEFVVTDDLCGQGFLAYCPTGQRPAKYESHWRRARKGAVRQFPAFSRYIFCGLLPGQVIGRDTRRRIESVLSNVSGPLTVPAAAIRHVNDLELAGEWDELRSPVEKMGLAIGSGVRITEGPFLGFSGAVSAIESESRIKVLIGLFGGPTPVSMSYGQVIPL